MDKTNAELISFLLELSSLCITRTKCLCQFGNYVAKWGIFLLLLVLLYLCVEVVSVHVTLFNTSGSMLWYL